MVVVGAMIGSGIFIVPAEMARHIGSAGWLLVAWGVAGALTIAGALCYGELSAMMPQAGGMYVYLREAYSPLWGFLYGWTLFSVIETGHDRGGGGRLLPLFRRAVADHFGRTVSSSLRSASQATTPYRSLDRAIACDRRDSASDI